MFSGDIKDTQPSTCSLISPCACTVIMSICVFSGDIQDTQPSTCFTHFSMCLQGSKIALVRTYLRVPQAAGQVEFFIFLVKINLFPMYTNIFAMQGKCLF